MSDSSKAPEGGGAGNTEASTSSTDRPEVDPASPYALIGGDEGVRALVNEFYDLMDRLPEVKTIREMHKGDLNEMREKLSVFLIGWMGGPQNYTERFGRVIIPLAHQPFDIGDAESDQWLLCMRRALQTSKLDEAMQNRLMVSFTRMALMCKTR
ncbi:MAG: group II truncated hemoglobin [Polyangiales bacterium]